MTAEARVAPPRIHDPRYELADKDAMRSLQWRKLDEMLRWVWATSAFYRGIWRSAGVDLERIDSFERFAATVPLVEKRDFVADQLVEPPFGTRLARAVASGERLDVYTTSGTSGQGVEVHAQTERELARAQEMYRFGMRWAGLNRGDTALLTLPLSMMAGGRVELLGGVGAGITVYPAGAADAPGKLDLIRRFRPRALYGSTSYFGHLAAVSDDPVDSLGIDVLLTGLEGAGFSYLEQMEGVWSAKAYDRFGATQVRADWMYTCEHGIGSADRPGLLHNLDPWVLLEVIDPSTGRHVADGELGELVVTSLFHFDAPVVRCRLHDQGVFRVAAYCPCGRPFDGVEICTIGRTDDVKKVKGVNVYPEAVDDLLYRLPEVDEYRVRLTSSKTQADIATVQVMTKGELEPEDRDAFATKVALALQERIGIRFKVELHGDLPRSEYKARRWDDQRRQLTGESA